MVYDRGVEWQAEGSGLQWAAPSIWTYSKVFIFMFDSKVLFLCYKIITR